MSFNRNTGGCFLMASDKSTSLSEKIEALKRAAFFAGLPEDVLRKVAAHAVPRRLARGEMLYSEHEEAGGLFVVAVGELRSIRQNTEGREQVLSTARPGMTLAEAPVFNGGRYFSTVIADSDSVVLCIDHADVHGICREHPEVLWNVARELARQVRNSAELIETLALRNVDQRLALYLSILAQDRSIKSGAGVLFELTLTRSQIASRLGSVREVISRSLAHLNDINLIALKGARLVSVPDVRALREFAGIVSPGAPEPFFSLA